MAELENLSGRMLGDFLLRERIDGGGFGDVYRCEQPLLGRNAVVKVLHPRLRRNDTVLQRFMREAQLASSLDHPYAAHIYAFGIDQADGLFWIAMELVRGTSLNRWLHERGPLPLEQFVPFFERVAEVVHCAHEQGIVHRDIKPSNVMVIEYAGRLLPKLLDFGVAKRLDDADPSPLPTSARRGSPGEQDLETSMTLAPPSETATLTGSVAPAARGGRNQKLTHDDATVGSPPYMSPEQWSNAVTVGPASDLYALGVVAYEALTGRRPFNAATVSDYVDLHCNAAVPPLGDGFSPALDRLFQRALAKRPEHRPRTALELAADLRVASGIGVSQSVDLPRLDEAVRDAWLAHAPQPLAESIAALDGARNAHQAHAAALDLVRNLLRYLFAIALATRAQVHTDRSEPALLELIRAMRRRDLTDDERVRMLRMLVRPLAERRGAHPIPELVDMVVLRADDGADGFDPILSILTANEQTGSEDMVRARLSQLVPLVTQVLRRTAFVLDYVLIVPHNQEPERWTGLRRQIRAVAAVRGGQPDKDHPMLLDRNEHICADLWPLVQSVPPTEGASRELFLFDGRGRNGARLVAVPAGYTHHDPSVWEWVAAKVLSTFDPNPEQPGDDHPPYLGLTPYTTSDAARFVGREWEVDHFLNRLRQRALQIVVGPSGAGKSSFVHAGVLPGLPPSWRALSLRPGAAPLAALAARLTSANLAPAELRALLETAPAKVAQAVSAAAGGSTIVIVIDQLEELFTMCSDQDERVKFAAALAQLSASPEAPIRVIGAIRDDFLMQLDALAPLRTVLSPALVLLGNPSREALVRIVVEPAKRAGYSIDADLANAMVDVVADQPGALALLSFTAARLWELRDRVFRELTRRAYDAMGGVGGALSRHAEDTLAEFPADDQPLVREVFRHLVSAEGTRALITAKDLRQRLASPRADAVIDKLVAARLVALSETDGAAHIEVIHDALFGAWPRLQQWVREDLDGARMREQLRVASRQWARRDRPGGLLWRDEALDDLERWLRRASPVALADEEAAFVEASRREARSARWTRRGLLVVGFAIVATGSAIWYGSRQSRAAEQLAEDRLTELVADRGRLALLDGKYNEALVYLAYAQNRGSPQAAVPWMLSRATEPLLRETRRLTLSNTWMWSTAFSPDQRWIVSTDDHGAALWPADRAADRPTWRLPHDDTVYEAAFTSDSRQVVTAGLDGVVKRWDVSRGQLLDTLSRAADPSLPRDAARNHPAKYHELATATDGRWVAALDNTSHLLDVWSADGHAVASIPVAGETSTLAASADGLRVAVADGPIVSVFDTRTWTRASTLAEPGAVKLSFAPGGGAVAVATPDGDVGLWDPRQGTRLDLLRGIGNTITSLAFSPNGEYLAAGMGGGVVRVWNAKTYRRYTDLRTSRPPAITSVAFDVSSTRLASTSADGTGTVWDLVSQVAVTAFLGNNLLRSVQFDAAGSHVIAASWDGTVRLWDATPQYRQWTTSAVEGDCAQGLVPDSDRRVVAVGCYGGATWVWDTTARRLLARLPIDTRPGAPPVVSADGQQVAIALGDTVATYAVGTDIDGGRLLQTITLPDQVAAVAFAPDSHNLASASVDGTIRVTRAHAATIDLPPVVGSVDALGWLDERRLFVAYAQRPTADRSRVRIIEIETGKTLAEHDLEIRAQLLRRSAAGGLLLILAHRDRPGPPVLWSMERLRAVARLDGHKGVVASARFVEDDRRILTTAGDSVARLWDAADGRLLASFTSPVYLTDAVLDASDHAVIGAAADGAMYVWISEISSEAPPMIWRVPAHRSPLVALRREGNELITRSARGEISRWALGPAPTSDAIAELVRCAPLKVASATGLVDQQPCFPTQQTGRFPGR